MMNSPRLRPDLAVWISLLASGLSFQVVLGSGLDISPTPSELFWNPHIEPLFNKNCFKCHGGVKQKGGLDLRTLSSIRAGGENGPVIVPGKPQESRLFKALQPGADPHMPPEEGRQLLPEEIGLLEMWILNLPSDGTSPNPSKPAQITTHSTPDSSPAHRKPASWIPNWTTSPVRVINRFVRRSWNEAGIRPSRLCSDATFVRRVYLDLAGRIPSSDEAIAFIASISSNKREDLIDALLASNEYPRHMEEVFDIVLMDGREGKRKGVRDSNGWHDFLESAFRENRPWNEIVRALVLGRPKGPEEKGALWFLYERKDNHQAMAEAVAPVAYGIQVKCAQCHNHPLAGEILQKHYWGLVTAFNRSKNVETQNGLGIAESAIGGFVKFTNLQKESQPAVLAFPDGTFIPEDPPAPEAKEEDNPANYHIPPPLEKDKLEKAAVPRFSRREQLANAVSRNNPFLSRAFVNRTWALLMGRGFVHPVDEMNSKHPPSHPELLDWLARDFERSGFDIKRLIRNIMLSLPYQLDSHPPTSPPALPEMFSYGLEKPLSAEVLARSLLVATGNDRTSEQTTADAGSNELRNAIEAVFPDLFPEQYNANLSQALFLSNSPMLDHLLHPREGNTTAELLKISDSFEKIQTAFFKVYGRAPDTEEMKASTQFLAARKSDPEAGIRHLIWGLLSSAEFQLNH